MSQLFTNDASAKLAASVAPSDVTFSVVTGGGAIFPAPTGSDFFIGTLEKADGSATEIVKCTARSSDTFTIVRAQEGTAAATFAAGDTFNLFLTAGALATIMLIVYNVAILALSGVTPAADKIPYFTSSSAAALLTRDTDPTLAAASATHIATQDAVKAYVDNAIAGLSWKQEVRAATTAAGTLASSFANGSVIDGVTLATGNRILIKNQATQSENGIYIVAASGAPARASDASTGPELVNATVFVSEGTTNADTMWTCTTNATITLGSTSLAFAQIGVGVSTLAALTDVVISSPANNDVLTYETSSSKWKNKPAATGSARATVTQTTASLADGATENSTVTLAKSGHLYQLVLDRCCRVELYATSADRTADASRAIGTPATPGKGVLFEYVADPGATYPLTVDLGPAVVYYNGDGSPSTSIYYAITNKSGSTHTVQVQFVHLGLET